MGSVAPIAACSAATLPSPFDSGRLVAVVPPGLRETTTLARFCRGTGVHVPIRTPVVGLVPVRHPGPAGTYDAVERLAGSDQVRPGFGSDNGVDQGVDHGIGDGGEVLR